jgi:hypothetical protein
MSLLLHGPQSILLLLLLLLLLPSYLLLRLPLPQCCIQLLQGSQPFFLCVIRRSLSHGKP